MNQRCRRGGEGSGCALTNFDLVLAHSKSFCSHFALPSRSMLAARNQIARAASTSAAPSVTRAVSTSAVAMNGQARPFLADPSKKYK